MVWCVPALPPNHQSTVQQSPTVDRALNARQSPMNIARRALLRATAGAIAGVILPRRASAAVTSFDQWIDTFRAKAMAHGITEEIYTRVMLGMRPDTAGLEAIRNQPEFNEKLWQYLNRRVSEWRIIAGKEKAKEYAALFARIENDFGVAPSIMLGVWGVESAFGDPIVQKNNMRPVIPSLAALAFGEHRRRAYWEQELSMR